MKHDTQIDEYCWKKKQGMYKIGNDMKANVIMHSYKDQTI